MASKELSIKLVINKKTGKLCFAEASGDVVEFLTGLLSLPLGTITSLLAKEEEGMVGSVGTLLGSVGTLLGSAETLGASYNIKELQLSPAVTPDTLSRLQQLLGIQLNGNGKFFACPGNKGGGTNCVHLSPINYSVCPGCKCYRQKAMTLAGAESGVVAASAMKPPTPKYTLKDDLSLTPESLSVISLLAECGVKDLSVLQEKIVNIGKEEALAILAAAFKSKTVLTDVFMPKKNARGKRGASEEDAMPKKSARCKTETPEEVIQI